MKRLKIILEENGMLPDIIDKLKMIEGIEIYGRKFSEKEINSAQQNLNIKFPQEYINILLKIGSFKIYDLEFTSLNNDNNNVINLTNTYKQLDSYFPLDCFVLEEFNNNMLTLCNSNGVCFEYICDKGFNNNNSKNIKKMRKIADSISQYIDFRINEEINNINDDYE